MSAIALLRDLGAPAPPPAIELPPADVVPDSVRDAMRQYAADASQRPALVRAVDQVGHEWEHAIASRALEARAELAEACRRTAELHAELVRLHAAERWLRSFPFRSRWEPEPYTVHVAGRQVLVVELLGAIEDSCTVADRLRRLARRYAPREAPYAGPPAPKIRAGSAPAKIALARAGVRLCDVAEPMEVDLSMVSSWFSGKRAYPDHLPDVLEQLLGAESAAQIVSLIASQQVRDPGAQRDRAADDRRLVREPVVAGVPLEVVLG